VFGFKSLIAANVAQFIFGQGLGSVFRFWAMHVWVFPESHKAEEAAAATQPAESADESFALEGAAGKTPIS